MKKKNKLNLGLFGLYVGYCLTSIAPVLAVVIINWSDYVSTPQKAVSLASGGVIGLTLIGLQLFDKMPKNLHRIAKYGILTLICWSLNAIIADLCLLMTCAFLGETAAWLIFTRPIKSLKTQKNGQDLLKILADKEELSGRV